jgi:hypothetical protein
VRSRGTFRKLNDLSLSDVGCGIVSKRESEERRRCRWAGFGRDDGAGMWGACGVVNPAE